MATLQQRLGFRVLHVGANRYTVHSMTAQDAADCWGATDFDALKISLFPQESDMALAETLVHELSHAIINDRLVSVGLLASGADEPTVEAFARGLIDVCRQQKALLPFLQRAIHAKA